MYSIVMLTAMSAGPDVPSTHPAPIVTGCYGGGIVMGGCSGYSSCYGSGYGSCFGSCYGSCMGRGGFLGKHRGGFLGGRGGSCHGCSGYSCSGWSCFGSCFGSCYGSCYGCSGASWAPPVMMAPYSLGCYGDPHAIYGRTYYPNQPPVITVPPAPPPMKKPDSGSDTDPLAANLKFKVPADAKIFVDGKPTPGTGPERAFYTPPLERGKKFFYDVKAELMVDGKPVTEEKKIIVEAGASITEEFAKLTAALAKSDNVAGK